MKTDFDSAIRRFDPSRPSHIFLIKSAFYGSGHSRHSGTIGTNRTHKSRHSAVLA
jgi:hypothetical protein